MAPTEITEALATLIALRPCFQSVAGQHPSLSHLLISGNAEPYAMNGKSPLIDLRLVPEPHAARWRNHCPKTLADFVVRHDSGVEPTCGGWNDRDTGMQGHFFGEADLQGYRRFQELGKLAGAAAFRIMKEMAGKQPKPWSLYQYWVLQLYEYAWRTAGPVQAIRRVMGSGVVANLESLDAEERKGITCWYAVLEPGLFLASVLAINAIEKRFTPALRRDSRVSALEGLSLLNARKSWRLYELPEGVGIDVLRALDAKGFIEVRTWTRGIQRGPDGRTVWHEHASLSWFSPIAIPTNAGDWEMIFKDAVMENHAAAEVRISDKGKAHLFESTVPEPAPSWGQARLVVRRSAAVALLNGSLMPLTPEGCQILVKIIEGGGQFVDREALTVGLAIARPDRVIARMPDALQHLIESRRGAGGGYRLLPTVHGTIEP